MLQYLVRGLPLLGWFLLASLWGLVDSILHWGNVNNGHRLGRVLAWGALRCMGVRVDIQGADHLAVQPCVYVANHQSSADLFLFGALYPARTVIVGKKELLRIPLFGLWFRAAGNILLDRQNQTKAISGMVAAGERVQKEGVSVWVFAEGHRNPEGPMLPFKKGAFHLACLAHVPVVPIVAANYRHAVNLRGKRLPGGTVHMTVLEPVSSEGHTPESLLEVVRARMEETLAGRQPPGAVSD